MKSTYQDMSRSGDEGLVAGDKESLSVMAERLREIGERTQELHRLLVRYAATLEDEGLRQQLETLESWMHVNAENLNMTVRIFEMGPVWLEELHQRLNVAIDDIERLAEEDDPRAGKDQRAQSRELRQVWSGVSNVLESMSKLFAGKQDTAESGKS
jgi:exonuclease VII small subunit